jgi:ABC-type multidrug transport system fused ATPase/permease subunit
MALARLFMREEAEIYVLDEPTAAVDAEAEAQIFEHVHRNTAGRMCILISHRLSFPRTADEIIVMDGGKIIERGTHAELMDLGGRYSDLFQLQASGYVD